jgi:hypothetical protein
MKTIAWCLMTAAIFVFSGCITPEWVVRTTQPVMGGTIRYPISLLLNDQYFEATQAEISNYCGGPELDQVSDAIVGSYRYLNFTCRGGH